MVEYEFQVLRFPREATRSQIRAALAEHAEYCLLYTSDAADE